ncbi:MAG: hypothetical protein GY810_23120 [Aureispira sp.]|nr:hypothetical protein [Aureispira sp.]
MVQTNEYVWSWDYKTNKEAFFEGECFFQNGYLCQMIDEDHYKFIDLATNEEIWAFEDSNITGCWFSPANSKEGKAHRWAILSRWDPNEYRGDAVFMDFNTKDRQESDLSLGLGGVDYSPDGSQAVVFDQNTQQLFIVNSYGNYNGKTRLEGNMKVKWLNKEDLLAVNQKDIKILTNRFEVRAEVFEAIPKLNEKRKSKGALRVLNEKSNKFTLDWDLVTPQLYKDYLFVNRRYESEGDEVLGAGFMYVPYHNREILQFPDFADDYVYPSAFILSDSVEKAWTVSSFYKKIEIDSNGFKMLTGYEKGYLLEFDLNPHKLFDRLKVSKKAVEELLRGTVMTIN